jgi:polyisoprenoid-binding protein YceI
MSEKVIRLTESAVAIFLSTAIGIFAAGYFTGQQLERSSNVASMAAAFRAGHGVAMEHMQSTIQEITKPGYERAGGRPGMGPGGPGGPPAGGPVEMTVSAEPTPVAIEAGVAALSPENSKIEFIGTHAGPRPDPRLGGFEKISGKAEVDEATKKLKSVSIDIDTRSVWTQIGGPLTSHLKSADFFDANEFPDAKFQSTEVEATDAEAGKFTVTGDLTLHGVTKPITAQATIKIKNGGLTLISQFSIDRTEFGITGVQDRVEKSVALTFVIGDKTQPKSGGVGFGGA